MNIKNIFNSTVFLLVFMTSGFPLLGQCASDDERMPQPNSPDYLDVVEVISQVCVPTKVVAFEDVQIDLTGIPKAKTLVEIREANRLPVSRSDNSLLTPDTEDQGDTDIVKRWIVGSETGEVTKYWLPFVDVSNRDGIRSAGKETINLFSNTDKNQPVYEEEALIRRQKDIVALSVSVDVEKNGQTEFVTYWFKLPKKIPTNEFSDWIEPISQEDVATRKLQKEATFLSLANGREMNIYKVGNGAPKMRFELVRIRDYYDENRYWYRDRKAIAEKYYRGAGAARESIHFVPKSSKSIPDC